MPGFAWWSTGRAGRSQVSEPKLQDKPFQIAKMAVVEAYERVKANKGAAGVDNQGVRGGPGPESVQDLEPAVVGLVFPAAGEGGGDP